MPAQGLQRASRLNKAAQFNQVLAAAALRVKAGYFNALALPNDGLPARLGMVIPRRHTRTAVRRNRIKRLIRESFRQQQACFVGLDIVVMLRSRSDATLATSDSALLTQLWQALRSCSAPGSSH